MQLPAQSSREASAPSEQAATRTVVISSNVEDALGSAGKWMTGYHVGDLTGIAGLLISFFGLWWTFREARAAKQASQKARSAAEQAQIAAETALRDRDRLEVAATLGELCARLRELRELTQSDDWAPLSMRFDVAATLAVRLLAAEALLTSEERHVVEEIRVMLRRCQTETNGVKDSAKKTALKKRLYADLMGMVDSTEGAQTKRLKHGPR